VDTVGSALQGAAGAVVASQFGVAFDAAVYWRHGVSRDSRNQFFRRGSRGLERYDHHDRHADFHDNYDDNDHHYHDGRNADRPNRDRR
jgi:hypothetical protein